MGNHGSFINSVRNKFKNRTTFFKIHLIFLKYFVYLSVLINRKLMGGLYMTVEEIYQLYFRDIYKYCFISLRNKQEAEDVTQEIFIKIINKIDQINDLSKIKPWIFQMTRRSIIDHFRKQKFKKFVSGELILPFIKSNEKTPEEKLELNSTKDLIYLSIKKLKPKYRDVFILRAIHGLSVIETSEILECSEGNVRVNYHRAVKQLKSYIQKELVKEGIQ